MTESTGFFQRDRVSNRRFRFERIDGTVICSELILRSDGAIALFEHENESSWSIVDGVLCLLNAHDEVTTRFDVVHSLNPLVISGPFIPDDPVSPWHKLVEIVTPMKTRLSRSFGRGRHSSKDRSVAVLLRSHLLDDKFRDLLEVLATGTHDYDLYPVLDATNGLWDDDLENALWHSERACKELGLTQRHPSLLWLCGDFPFYFALRDLPPYSHYIMLEYDVELVRHNAEFLSLIVDQLRKKRGSGIDAVGLGLKRPHADWEWTKACHRVYADVWSMYFPFVILSRRAASYMYGQRQLEAFREPKPAEIIHCEAFTPSCLKFGGFHCMDLNELVPGCYSMPLMSLAHGGYMGQQRAIEPPIEMIHPIYEPQLFLRRFLGEAEIGRVSKREFLDALRSENFSSLPRDLLDTFESLGESLPQNE